jgi:predicted nucleotidyltransferase component of viral defense system
MIKAKEISGIAVKRYVSDLQIEKDYVLSWLLYGIACNSYLKENLIFRGGSLLKKVYFPSYRFAEELELTCKKNFDLVEIKTAFTYLVNQVRKMSGLVLTLRGDMKEDGNSYNFGISYSGLLGGIASAKFIRIDINKNELLYYTPVEQKITSEYSDLTNENISLNCYSIDELVAEKMRALMEYNHSADVYDVWYLLEMDGYFIEDCIFGFRDKASFRKINFRIFKPTVEKKVQEFAKHWRDDLVRQMKTVPDYHDVWRQLEKFWRRYQKFIDK